MVNDDIFRFQIPVHYLMIDEILEGLDDCFENVETLDVGYFFLTSHEVGHCLTFIVPFNQIVIVLLLVSCYQLANMWGMQSVEHFGLTFSQPV